MPIQEDMLLACLVVLVLRWVPALPHQHVALERCLIQQVTSLSPAREALPPGYNLQQLLGMGMEMNRWLSNP